MFVEIVSALGSLTTTTLGILAYQNNKFKTKLGLIDTSDSDSGLEWEMSETHKEVQRRIDLFLCGQYSSYINKDSWHWDSPKEAAKGLFAKATTDTTDGINNFPVKVPKDSVNSYSYPSYAALKANGNVNNLNNYVRCAPANVGCQLFDREISVGDFVFMLIGVAVSIVVTWGASTIVIIGACVATLSAQIMSKPKFSDKAVMGDELINIYNGADIITNDRHEAYRVGGELYYKMGEGATNFDGDYPV